MKVFEPSKKYRIKDFVALLMWDKNRRNLKKEVLQPEDISVIKGATKYLLKYRKSVAYSPQLDKAFDKAMQLGFGRKNDKRKPRGEISSAEVKANLQVKPEGGPKDLTKKSIDVPINKPKPVTLVRSGRHVCSCGKVFNNNIAFERHEKRTGHKKRRKFSEIRYKCQICGGRFITNADFLSHKMSCVGGTSGNINQFDVG